MGLQKADSDRHGNSYPTAYLNIASVSFNLNRQSCHYSLSAFKDKAARDANNSPFRRYNRNVSTSDYATYCGIGVLDVADMNLIKSLYNHAKTTFGKEDLIDILE